MIKGCEIVCTGYNATQESETQLRGEPNEEDLSQNHWFLLVQSGLAAMFIPSNSSGFAFWFVQSTTAKAPCRRKNC